MATPKKPQTVMEQLAEILRDIVTEPMSDQSSHTPTPADVYRARTAMHAPAPRKKKPAKARARPASKKKPVAKRKKAKVTVKKVSRKKTARAKGSKKG